MAIKKIKHSCIKLKSVFLASFFLLASISCASSDSDEVLKKRIIGGWSATYPEGKNGVSSYGEGYYKSDGTMEGWQEFYDSTGLIHKSEYNQIWEIKNGKLISKPAKKYKDKELNVTIVDEIVTINNNEMILFSAKGKKLIRERLE